MFTDVTRIVSFVAITAMILLFNLAIHKTYSIKKIIGALILFKISL